MVFVCFFGKQYLPKAGLVLKNQWNERPYRFKAVISRALHGSHPHQRQVSNLSGEPAGLFVLALKIIDEQESEKVIPPDCVKGVIVWVGVEKDPAFQKDL